MSYEVQAERRLPSDSPHPEQDTLARGNVKGSLFCKKKKEGRRKRDQALSRLGRGKRKRGILSYGFNALFPRGAVKNSKKKKKKKKKKRRKKKKKKKKKKNSRRGRRGQEKGRKRDKPQKVFFL